jgi:membrane protease YdiL (CAAX protease family)
MSIIITDLTHLFNLFISIIGSYYFIDKYFPRPIILDNKNIISENEENIRDKTNKKSKKKPKTQNENLKLDLTLSTPNLLGSDVPKLFSAFSLKNFHLRLLDGFGLLLLVYIPLDCLSYIFPDLLEYSASIFDVANTEDPLNYFLFPFGKMVLFTLIFNLFIATREEFIFRGFFLYSGKIHVNRSASYLYSACAFGFAHFSYIFTNTGYSFLYPVYWGINAFLIGIFSAWYYLKKGNLWPVIIAHLLNNTISSIAIRFHVLGESFWEFTVPFLYGPFIISAIILYIIRLRTIKKIIRENIAYFKEYFETNSNIYEKLFDLVIIGFMFLTSGLLIGS